MAIADRPDALEIVADRRRRAQGGADYGFGDEGDHALGADLDDLVLERLSRPRRIVSVALARAAQAVGIAGVDMVSLDEKRLELRAPPGISSGGERSQGVAVIALTPGDDATALRLADLDKILARHLERRFDRLRTAADEIDVIEPGRRVLDQPVGEALCRVGGEKGGMRVSQPVQLIVQRSQDIRMAVAKARDGGPAGSVEIALAVGVDDLDAGAGDGDRHDSVCGAMQNMRHKRFTRRVAGGTGFKPSYAPGGSDGKAGRWSRLTRADGSS